VHHGSPMAEHDPADREAMKTQLSPAAGALQRLARHTQHSALRGWQDWTAERVVLRHRLQRALAHWQHGALAAAFARLR
jgi:hypothetical protein